jgi:WD40 repeat protein
VVTAVAFFADPQTGKCLLASGQSDRTLRVWDPLKGGDYLQQDVLPDKVRAIAPSFDGLCLAVSLGMMFEPERAAAGMFLTA